MYLHTKSGKKIASIIAAFTAFVVIGATGSITVNAASISSGTSGSQVVQLQTKLKGQGYFKANCTGYYGSITKNAVSAFQKDNGLTVTGEVDSSTYNAIFGTSSYSGTGTVTATYLNARSGPGTNYAIIGGFNKGATVTITDKQGNWYKVKISSSKTGWVSSDYVKTGSTSSSGSSSSSSSGSSSSSSSGSTTSTSTSKKIVITASTLNARSGASTSSAILGVVRQNEVYTYTSVKNGWYMIKLPSGKSAYICGDYVKSFSSYAIKGGGSYIWPLQTSKYITSYFGARNGSYHYGIDIAAAGGSQIIAAVGGKVVTNAYEANGFGYYVVIQQSDGIKAYYGHMKQASFLKVGDTVKAGDTVGMVGSTGRSTGNHLHLEFRKNGKKVNPLNYYPNIK